MTNHQELTEIFYDLVLKKSVDLSLKSLQCYLELSHQGKELAVMATLMQSKPGLMKLILKELPYFKSGNLLIDNKNNQIILIKKFDFSNMSPETFSLSLLQFHSEIMKYRDEINRLDQEEGVQVPR